MLPFADDDECTLGTHNCAPSASCINNPGGWTCRCKRGFSGTGQACTGTMKALLSA